MNSNCGDSVAEAESGDVEGGCSEFDDFDVIWQEMVECLW